MCPAEERDVKTDAEPGPTILFVEDETLIRMSAAEHLRDAGFTVMEAANGAEARAVTGPHGSPLAARSRSGGCADRGGLDRAVTRPCPVESRALPRFRRRTVPVARA